jgi:outer membrane protein assembly factor BamB
VCLLSAAVAHGDWRQFRGDDTSSVSPDAAPPTDWSADSVIDWQVELPGRGLSSPIVIGDQVVVTASSGYRQDRLHVLSFAASDGGLQWEREFWATGRTVSHPKTCVAAPTPASDGERIFAFYSSNDVVCLDLAGNLLWYRGLTHDYPNASNSLGMSSSLIVADDTLVAMVENDTDSFTVGLDVTSGEERWKIGRPRRANWTSPALWTGGDGGQLVLLQSSAGVSAVEPRTGEETWTYGDGASTIPSLVAVDGVAYVPSHGITAIRPGGNTPEVAEILWQEGNIRPDVCSPVVDDGLVYVLMRPNILICASAEDGKEQWKVRLTGNYSGSPVIADDHLFVFSEEGTGHVVDLSGNGELVSTRELEETILSTPAVSGNALYIRSDGHLWKFGD